MSGIKRYIETLIRSFGIEVTDGLWIVWLASVVLITFSILFFAAVIISRLRKDYIARWELAFNHKVEPLLLALIYGGYATFDAWKSASEFEYFEKKYLSKARGRKSFVQTIAVLRSRLNGEDANRLAEVYRKAGLYKHSIAALNNRNWHIKAAAIHELGALNYVEAVPLIRKLADHPHEEVRSMAQLALIQLDDSDPFGFLDKLGKPISKNAMIRLHGAMLQKQSLEIKSFGRWLKSENPDVVLFATSMAGLFNTAADVDLLVQLVQHPYPKIAKAAIISLEQLGAQDTLIDQVNLLSSAPTEIQLQLIKSVDCLGFKNEKVIAQWLQSDSFEIVKAAYTCYLSFETVEKVHAVMSQFPGRDHLTEILAQHTHFKRIQQS